MPAERFVAQTETLSIESHAWPENQCWCFFLFLLPESWSCPVRGMCHA